MILGICPSSLLKECILGNAANQVLRSENDDDVNL